MKIILASKSPARKKLLSQLGLKFEVVPAEIHEDKIREKSPSETVKKIALEKAKVILNKLTQRQDLLIISADTMVYIPNSKIKNQKSKFIGKPEDKNEAKRILTSLSGSTHWLYSGICVLCVCHCERTKRAKQSSSKIEIATATSWPRNDVRVFLDFDKSKVTFRKLSEEEIEEYVNNNTVHLWAGAYTIEKGTAGSGFIKKIKGSSSNVLGLPVKKLKKILASFLF